MINCISPYETRYRRHVSDTASLTAMPRYLRRRFHPSDLSYFLVAMALCPGMPRLGQNATCNSRADQLMPGDAFVARSIPSDTSLELPYRPVPEQNHAE